MFFKLSQISKKFSNMFIGEKTPTRTSEPQFKTVLCLESWDRMKYRYGGVGREEKSYLDDFWGPWLKPAISIIPRNYECRFLGLLVSNFP